MLAGPSNWITTGPAPDATPPPMLSSVGNTRPMSQRHLLGEGEHDIDESRVNTLDPTRRQAAKSPRSYPQRSAAEDRR